MTLTRTFALAGVAALSLSAAEAHAATTIQIFANLGPTRVGAPGNYPIYSPSFDAYTANAIAGILAGGVSSGDNSTDPAAFTITAQRSFIGTDVIATEFTSWRGNANPTGTFANEQGTFLRFGIRVVSDEAFTVDDLFETYQDSDGADFTYSYDFAKFDDRTVGVRYTGAKGGGDDLTFTTGAASGVALNEFVFVGGGNLGFVFNSDLAASGLTEQELLDDINGFFAANPFSATYSYQLRSRDGQSVLANASDSYRVGAAVPEPATWAMLILGFGMTGAATRRRAKAARWSRALVRG